MKNNLKFVGMILTGILVVLFLLLSVLSLNDVQAQYDGYPPPGYPVPIDVGYPAPQPTEISGYPAPMVSDPPSPFHKPLSMADYNFDFGNEEDFIIQSPIKELQEVIIIAIRSMKTNKTIHIHEIYEVIQCYGKFILEMQ